MRGTNDDSPDSAVLSYERLKIMASYSAIEIQVDGVWAGSGKMDGGYIRDCSAQFCVDADESEEVYEMIEDAITEGRERVKVELSGQDKPVVITWAIIPPTE